MPADTVEQLQKIGNQLKNKCVAAEMVYTKYYHFILTIRNVLLKCLIKAIFWTYLFIYIMLNNFKEVKRKVMLTFFIREKQMFIILIYFRS